MGVGVPPARRRRRWRPATPPLASAAGAIVFRSDDEDAFTRCSGYLFEEGVATESELPTAYDLPGIAAVYRRRPFLVLRRSLQIGTSFGRWFALRYLDRVNDRADDTFGVRPLATLACDPSRARPLFDQIPPVFLVHLRSLTRCVGVVFSASGGSAQEDTVGAWPGMSHFPLPLPASSCVRPLCDDH